MAFKDKRVDALSLATAKYKKWCDCGLYAAIFYPFEHRNKKICKSCGKYIYVNEEEEFKERLKQELWKRK